MFVPENTDNLLPIFDLVPVEEAYAFEHQKFYEGHVWIDGPDNFTRLRTSLKSTFGAPSFENEKLNISKWRFSGTGIEIHLHYQVNHQKSTLTYTNRDIK